MRAVWDQIMRFCLGNFDILDILGTLLNATLYSVAISPAESPPLMFGHVGSHCYLPLILFGQQLLDQTRSMQPTLHKFIGLFITRSEAPNATVGGLPNVYPVKLLVYLLY
jgi:hypothetical protein